jgi:hypothetical protein
MPKTTVVIDGNTCGPMPGFHVFVRGNPPRLVCYIRGHALRALPESVSDLDDRRFAVAAASSSILEIAALCALLSPFAAGGLPARPRPGDRCRASFGPFR